MSTARSSAGRCSLKKSKSWLVRSTGHGSDDDETTFTTDHVREDETVFGFVVSQSEGEFAGLSLELKNPRVGLLAPGRKVWGWLSWDNGSEIGSANAAYGAIPTCTGAGLIAEWPKTGAGIGGGWTVVYGNAVDIAGIANIKDDAFTIGGSILPLTNPYPSEWLALPTLRWTFVNASKQEAALVPVWHVVGTLRLGYDVERSYAEQVRFTMEANVQPILTMLGEDEVLEISIKGADVGLPIDGVIPIGDVRHSQYFVMDRGLESVAYLIALARATLAVRSRAVEVEFDCRFERAVNLSLRQNARVFDNRLPGGNALGKIIQYSFSADGDSGTVIGKVTIGCAIGYGGAVTEVAGDPAWIDDDYIEDDYQEHDGQLVVLGPGDVGYTLPSGPPNDDGLYVLDVRTTDVATPAGALGGRGGGFHTFAEAQKQACKGVSPNLLTTQQYEEVLGKFLEQIPTKMSFSLRPVEGGPFETLYNIDVTELELPAMINLEANS